MRTRLLALAAAVLVATGLTLLLLPYDTTVHADLLATDLDLPCVAPLVDLAGGGAGAGEANWLNVDPEADGGRGEFESERLGGEWCLPESRNRAIAGGLASMGGSGLALVALALRRRDRAGSTAPDDGHDGGRGPGLGRGNGPADHG